MIVEIKSAGALAEVHDKQLLTYLRLTNKTLGLVVNAGVVLSKKGITRIVNGLREPSGFLCVFRRAYLLPGPVRGASGTGFG